MVDYRAIRKMSHKELDSMLEEQLDGLERMRTATNVHTINKAIGYLSSYSKPCWWIEDEDVRLVLRRRHMENCQFAIERGKVDIIKVQMGRWL